MSNTIHSKAEAPMLAGLGTLLAIASAPFAAIVRGIADHRQMSRLEALNDHMLADIGLTRGDLARARAEGFGEATRILERSRGAQ